MPLTLAPKNNSSINIAKDLASAFIPETEIAKEASQLSKNIFSRRKAVKEYHNKRLLMIESSKIAHLVNIRKQYHKLYQQNNYQVNTYDRYLILLQVPSFTKDAHKKMQLDNIDSIIDAFPSNDILASYLESLTSIKEFYNINSLHAKIIKLGSNTNRLPDPIPTCNISSATITRLISNQDIVNELKTMSHYASIYELPLFSKFIQETNIPQSSAELILTICHSEKVYDLEEFLSCH